LRQVKELILALRDDLASRFLPQTGRRRSLYRDWLILSGIKEYRALLSDSKFRHETNDHDHDLEIGKLAAAVWRTRPDVQAEYPLPQFKVAYLQWFLVHGVGEHGIWPLLTQDEQATTLKVAALAKSPWLRTYRRLSQLPDVQRAKEAVVHGLAPFGVNLIGYAYGQLGIGEDLRMTSLALKATRIPFVIVNFEPGADVPQGDRTLAPHVVDTGPYAINLFCMTALETGRFYAERGLDQFQGRHNIGYWPWELSKWPADWTLVFDLVDEVWVSTAHIKKSLLTARSPRFAKPIRVMPLVVQVPSSLQKARSAENTRSERKGYRLPLLAKLFFFSFDLNSSIHRKNPAAVVKAFQRAFPAEDYSPGKVGLVVKVQAPKRPNRAWEELKKLANTDRRIHIIEGTLPRNQLLALYKSCDCFVSLHRAEGFGRNLAEALQLGLHVIATDYSGNTDFCRRPEFKDQVSLIPHRLIKVRKGQYPYAEGQVWANPSVAAAAKAMRDFVERPNPSYKVPRGGWPAFKASILGEQYRARLEEIYQIHKARNKAV